MTTHVVLAQPLHLCIPWCAFLGNRREVGGRLGREAQEGGDIRTPVADSSWHMAETNPML